MRLHADAVAVLSGWCPDPVPYAGGPCPDDQEILRDRYLDLLRERADATHRECTPAHLTASGIVLDPTGSATLLVLHRKLGLWVQPGGHCEPGDRTLAGAAEREVVEETGLDRTVTDPNPVLLSAHQFRGPVGDRRSRTPLPAPAASRRRRPWVEQRSERFGARGRLVGGPVGAARVRAAP